MEDICWDEVKRVKFVTEMACSKIEETFLGCHIKTKTVLSVIFSKEFRTSLCTEISIWIINVK